MRRKKPEAVQTTPEGDVTFELTEEEKEGRADVLVYHPLDSYTWDPPKDRRIPKGGGWIWVIRELPPIENSLHLKVRPGMAFWAKHEEGTDKAGFRRDGYYKIKLTTPWGDLCLWPYEYTAADPVVLAELWQGKELVFHASKEGVDINEAVFYIMSRGIPLAQAVPMALGTLNGPVGWFRPVARLQKQVEDFVRGFGDPIGARPALVTLGAEKHGSDSSGGADHDAGGAGGAGGGAGPLPSDDSGPVEVDR